MQSYLECDFQACLEISDPEIPVILLQNIRRIFISSMVLIISWKPDYFCLIKAA